MIGKISAPRGERAEPLIYYLYGPGRREEHTLTMRQWYRDDLEPLLRATGFAAVDVSRGIDQDTLVYRAST